MGARGHLNGAAWRRRRSGLCELAGETGYLRSITTRGALLGHQTQLPATPNFCISQPRPTLSCTPAGVHGLSCALTRRSSPPKPPATSGYRLATLRVGPSRMSEGRSQPAGLAEGSRWSFRAAGERPPETVSQRARTPKGCQTQAPETVLANPPGWPGRRIPQLFWRNRARKGVLVISTDKRSQHSNDL